MTPRFFKQGGRNINNSEQHREPGNHTEHQNRPEELFNEQFLSQAYHSELPARLSTIIPGFSRLLPTDADLFRRLFQPEDWCYANSWLYLLRAARDDQGGLGYKFVSKDMVASIGYRDHSFYIVHPMGTGRYQALLDLCMHLYEFRQGSIILKKIDQELYEQFSTAAPFPIDSARSELFEEEAFPEHILQLERLFVVTPETKQQLQPLLKKVQRFERQARLWPVPHVAWKELESNPGFQKLFGHNPAKYNNYARIIQEVTALDRGNGRYKVCSYYDERGTIHGLYVSELFEQGIMGLYCAVSAKSFPGVTEWMDYDFFRQLFQEGIHTLYLGGSETEGVHAYIQKLLPVVPTYLMRPLLLRRAGG